MKMVAMTGQEELLLWRFLELRCDFAGEDLSTHPIWSRYARDWGRDGDFGLRAEKLRDGERTTVGLIWSRLYSVEAPGYGFISPDIPEMMLVAKSAPDLKRVRDQLLDRHLSSLRHRFDFVSTLIGSDDINTMRLYQSAGFYAVDEPDKGLTKLLLNLQR